MGFPRECPFFAIALIALIIPAAHAQRADDYPSKPIRMIVPFAPGGPPDVIGRPVVQKLSEALGQPILFDNRPGAAGAIGTEVVAKSPRDGYTLLYTTGLPQHQHADVPQAPVRRATRTSRRLRRSRSPMGRS